MELNLTEKELAVLEIAQDYGGIDGAHHKQYMRSIKSSARC